jgi:hypothetical protein
MARPGGGFLIPECGTLVPPMVWLGLPSGGVPLVNGQLQWISYAVSQPQ